ncbi:MULTISPECIES: hypothetical protein [Brachybacterium]|uniref:Histidine kinase N-terminal 7TM region domain-containing protein n=1 Tax=Brachybacterium kimchii TaxID=2942909 RepID=A0ABY4N909_9MICO|nr:MULTISPECIES: hypothetical protein [Brachybacterium]MCG7308041.1 hypothetical protein [Brachybacterium sp. ACRRE]UQN30594.1 hypothetical protein M4486_04580 [Brachybacterium kimchii]
MAEIIVVGIAMGLVAVVATLYRGRRRVMLLRIACVALFITTVCRGIEPGFNGSLIDLAKRYSILLAQVCVVLIILSFREEPLSRRATRAIWAAAGVVALGEAALVGFLPVHADGEVYHQAEVDEVAKTDQAWALVLYHGLYLAAFAAAAIVVLTACGRTLLQRNQPASARFSVGCVFLGALGTALFVVSSMTDLTGRALLGGPDVRKYLLIGIVSIFLVGLATGVIRRITLSVHKTLALQMARDLVIPLWRTTTTLHPDVRLPEEEQRDFNELMTLSRLTIETHDALRLIREDDDPALRSVHEESPDDPQLSARLVRHLSGERSVPPLGWLTIALNRMCTLELRDDEELNSSVRSLYEIRLAMSRP